MPVEVLRYGFVTDSGGPGRNRGGLAFTRDFRFLQDMSFNLRGDRRDHPPFGIEGGAPGAPSAHLLVSADGTEQNLPTMPMRGFMGHKDDSIRLVGAGGGGFGDPFEREPQRVLADVIEEKVSVEGAAHDYGVVVSGETLAVDEEATRKLRSERRRGTA